MENKIALVTGGSRGLGKSMALHLAKKGVDVIITYHSRQEEAANVVKEIEALGQKAIALKLDVADIDSLAGFMEEVVLHLRQKWNTGAFDFLINNAGTGATLPFQDATPGDFDALLNVHFKGVYFLTQKALPLLNNNGRIINISSGTTRFANPGYSIYASMKGAIETFTMYLAKEAGPRGITANVVAPGPIETDFNHAAIRNNPQFKAQLASLTAMGRTGEPNDIGGFIGDSR